MRQLLVDAARRRHSQKRGGTDAIFVTFDESTDAPPVCGRDLIALDTALHELSCFEPRQAILIESRFFGGLSMSETAELLGVSEATLHRDWRVAKAWLAQAMQRLA